MPSWRRVLREVADWLGVEVKTHPGRRRVQLLRAHGVDLFLDAGAASGQTGRDLRRHGYDGRIVSFEPLSAAFAGLSRAAAADDLWDVRNEALGSVSERAWINVAQGSDASSFLPISDRTTRIQPSARYVGREEVLVARLDDVAHEVWRGATSPFLKVDVQGLEGAVLEGASASIDRIQGLQLELSLVPVYEGGSLFLELAARVRDLGFELVGLHPGFLDPLTGELLQVDGTFFRRRA